MILRSLLRRPAALREIAATPIRCNAPFRSIHHKPTLMNQDELEKNGIPGLLSKSAFKQAWTEYQQYVVDELNICSAGQPWENMEPKAVTIDTARDPMKAVPFNFASMAWNNHFFFKGIVTDPNIKSQPSPALTAALNTHFSSLDSLRATFLDTAEAMFGPGFVWLVQTNGYPQSLRILTTYLAGTPLSGAHYRRQSHDLNTHNPDSYASELEATNSVGAFGANSAAGKKASKDAKRPLGGVDIVPLMCVNTWEHVWLGQYGVRGKRDFLEKWWERIDWSVVESAATLQQPRREFGQYQFKS